MVEVNKEYFVTIERMDHFGSGIGVIDGFVVFVAGTMIGEKVKIKITKCKKQFGVGEVVEFLKKTSARKQIICPNFAYCGGCQLMHQDDSYQLQFKEHKILELLDKFVGLDVNVSPIIYGKFLSYRNKVIFHGQNGKVGFYQKKTNVVVPISKCFLIDSELNRIYQSFIVQSFSGSERMLRKSSLGEVMVYLNTTQDSSLFLDWAKDYKIASFYINDRLVWGKEYITELILGMRFLILPKAFFQVNYHVMLKMYQFIVDYYQKKSVSVVLDLYCGTGTIGMLVSPYVERVIGVEVVEDAISSALRNRELNQISNISFVLGKVEDHIDEFHHIDSVIVDPPRSGLDRHTIETIIQIHPQSIIYVSCDPATLARDLKTLASFYEITIVQPFDMFPNTYHVETVCVLERK